MIQTDTLRAIGLMVGAMAFFALSDLGVKFAARSLSGAEIFLGFGVIGFVVFGALTLRAGLTLWSPLFFNRIVVLRNLTEVFATACMVSALVLAPLSLVASITQAMPLVVTAGAALFLGETVGPRRWIAVLIGMAGVLLILRPGMTDLSLGALLAVGATFGLGARDVITRLVPRGISNLQLVSFAFMVLVPAGVIFVALNGGFGATNVTDVLWLLFAAATGVLGYYAITAAMRIGDVATVSPFRYTRLLFALILATVFLGERPDGLTLIGAAIVIGSGLFVLLRERMLARRRLSQTAKPR